MARRPLPLFACSLLPLALSGIAAVHAADMPSHPLLR